MMNVLHFLFGSNQCIDRSAFWAGIAVVLALLGVVIAFWQLSGIRKISRADFAKRFNDTFFTKETRTLFSLLLNSALEFEVLKITDKDKKVIDRMPFLKIRRDVVEQLNGIVQVESGKVGYSAFEVDDLLLGCFDDLGWYEKRKLIDLETIKQAFGYYICESYENAQIIKYLADEDNKGKYIDFRYIYAKVNRKTVDDGN